MRAVKQTEFNRAYCIKCACNGFFTIRETAERLCLCARRIKRLHIPQDKRRRLYLRRQGGALRQTKRRSPFVKTSLILTADTGANSTCFTEILQEHGISYHIYHYPKHTGKRRNQKSEVPQAEKRKRSAPTAPQTGSIWRIAPGRRKPL